jgi:hypothetical protein
MYGKTQRTLVREDYECLTNWENYVLLDRLPHELGLTPEPYTEDIEAIKTMKQWIQRKEEKENRREASKRRMRERMRSERGSISNMWAASSSTTSTTADP